MDASTHIFVSYSSVDRWLVESLIPLLRLSCANVFFDKDSIIPGTKWRNEIEDAILKSKKVVVFWSVAASDSKYVQIEYELATALKKDIVPILIDGTPLPNELSEYQWIDFRSFFAEREKRYRRFMESDGYEKQEAWESLNRTWELLGFEHTEIGSMRSAIRERL